jgi:pimeloyl-ACP methyl ester carboxylesterase
MKNYFGERFLKNSPLLFEMMCKTLVKNREKVGDSVLDAAQMQLKAASNFDGESLLSKIFTKTLVISGDADAVVPLANSYYLKDHIKNSSLIVYQDVGHLILIEEPDLFVSDICTFLS